MRLAAPLAVGAALTLALAAPHARAQDAPARTAPAIGQQAPAFTAAGATRHGRVADPIRLSDYHGKTVILAFFFRARTTG